MTKSRAHGYIIFPLLLFVFPFAVHATGIKISPLLIEETLSSRQDSQNLVTLKSDYSDRKAVLYATVNEINIDTGGEIKEFVSPVMTDRTSTVTSWIEVTRGRIEIPPGESREVPVSIRLHPYAKPGEYYVFVGFVEAPNRPGAEAKALAGKADGVIVKVTVEDDRQESMKINSFEVSRFVTGEENKEINIEIENLGDFASAPEGELIFYDSRGVEVTSLPVAGDEIQPGEKGTIKAEIPIDQNLGKYKANLSLKYGENQVASLFDTNFFYFVPLNTILFIFGAVLIFSIVIVLLFRRAFASNESSDSFDDVTMYLKEGHDPNPKEHDIDLKKDK